MGRFISTGGLLADLVLRVERVPGRGEDVLAESFEQTVGGCFAVIATAARLGVPTVLAGALGGDAVAAAGRAALRAEGIELLVEEPRPGSSGVCAVMVDADGERTMVTVQGVESELRPEDFAAIEPGPGDIVYLSGYDLVYPHAEALVNWLVAARPECAIFDPGPLVAEIDGERLEAVLGAVRWLSLNAVEARALSGEEEPASAAAAALARWPGLAGVVVRLGGEGCLLLEQDGADGRAAEPQSFPALPAEVADTTGAGDTHVGAFSAALLRGVTPTDACRWGNAAASVVVTQPGQSSPPHLADLLVLLG